ncbi:MAG: hypothetical protein HC828_13930 [Blastochloris sp.]|nr:hypothetical protein [Blastochloris sp.]
MRLTLDLDVQRAVVEAMGDQRGAAVVISIPDGGVLSLVSLPTYDPNQLDANWEGLRDDPGRPFFNRVLQGGYQPGGTLQTPLMAAALLLGEPLDLPMDEAAAPLSLDGLTLDCAVRLPPDLALTLRESYTFACPTPFAALAADLGSETVASMLDTFRLDETIALPGYLNLDEATAEPSSVPFPTDDVSLIEMALGQGELTISPLNMATMAGAIVNDGNAPQPYTLLATRSPDGEWLPDTTIRPTLPVATANTARRLQDLMRAAVATGAAQNAGRPALDIGGHAALAYAGESSQAWFIGFATLGGRRSAAVAVVLENSQDPGLAADIGGAALAAARQSLNDTP